MKPLDWFYITLICALGAVTFWGAFDIRHRYHDVLLAQATGFICAGILAREPPMKVELLLCGNNRSRQARGNGWTFPAKINKQIVSDCAGKTVLHLFGGRAKFGTRIDIDPIVRPDVIADAWLPPFGRDAFDVVVLDPPYFQMNAEMKVALFRTAAWIARERIIWFATVWQSASGGLALERGWLVRCGDNCHVRCLQYFSIKTKLGPVKHFARGPAVKYNRWLAQPAALPFSGQQRGPT